MVKTPLGRIIEACRIDAAVWSLKRRLVGPYEDTPYLSTLESSPHLQRFSLASIQATLDRAGFRILDSTGSVSCSRDRSATCSSPGVVPFMRMNCRLGSRFPKLAASFFVAVAKR